MITIGIAEDQALFRKGIVALLNSFENITVEVEAENGKDLVEKYATKTNKVQPIPLITILDLRMPVLDGIKTTEQLKTLYPNCKIIIISSHNDNDIIVHLYEKGANAFLDKNAEPEEVEIAINNVLQNDFYFNQAAQQALDDVKNTGHQVILLPEDALTNRELEILKLICQEKTANEIAQQLSISKRTVDNHRTKLLQKTNAKNITGLVLFAIKTNLVSSSELKINLYA